MKKKSIIMIIILLLFAASLITFVIFYWKNYRGIGPSIKPSPQDISEIIEKETKKFPDRETKNTTEMPLKLPNGFSISIFAKNLGNARVLAIDPNGVILVSAPAEGKVFALPDKDKNGTADSAEITAENLNKPHGLAFQCADKCKLYIAETDQAAVYDYNPQTFEASNKQKLVDLPDGGDHFTRTILFLPPPNDNKLLISVGSSCNVCKEDDSRRAKILVLDTTDSSLRTYAEGLRNSVFLALHPETKKVWATEMGRDYLGDNLPPDEINIIEEEKNYGWPYCYGKKIFDTNFENSVFAKNLCENSESSYIDIPAHSAPLGLAFIAGAGWPEDYQNNLLVAYHGSWNRTVPTGYKIVRYKFDKQGDYLGEEDFISGWLVNNSEAFGRPVDILSRDDGKLYISDDKAGVIYLVER